VISGDLGVVWGGGLGGRSGGGTLLDVGERGRLVCGESEVALVQLAEVEALLRARGEDLISATSRVTSRELGRGQPLAARASSTLLPGGGETRIVSK